MPLANRPLPLRVDPALGESWAGYTRRVAAFYEVTWRTLVRHALLGGSGTCPSPLGWSLLERTEGVAITNETAVALAHYFRLTRDQVLDMHLIRFEGSALIVDDGIRREFDPNWQSAARRYVHELGAVWSTRRAATCRACLREKPHYRPLTWRLRWHAVCVRHGVLITDAPEDQHGFTATPAILAAQAEILGRLTPSDENRMFFQRLHFAVQAAEGPVVHVHPSMGEVPPARLAELLPAILGTTSALLRPTHAALSKGRDYRSLERRLSAYLPLRPARPAGPALDHVPLLLPPRWFVPDLSDLSYPLALTAGRSAGAAAVLLLAGGHIDDLRDRYGVRLHGPSRLLELLQRLEQEGRLENYWAAVRVAADGVLNEAIDYQMRTRMAADERTYDRARDAIPAEGQNHRLLRTWLVDQWACTFISTYRSRSSVVNGRIEDFDREYGVTLTAVLASYSRAMIGATG